MMKSEDKIWWSATVTACIMAELTGSFVVLTLPSVPAFFRNSSRAQAVLRLIPQCFRQPSNSSTKIGTTQRQYSVSREHDIQPLQDLSVNSANMYPRRGSSESLAMNEVRIMPQVQIEETDCLDRHLHGNRLQHTWTVLGERRQDENV
jgi:hypothetical protein